MDLPSTAWHTEPPEKIFSLLESSRKGLSSVQAKQRLTQVGPNALPSSPPKPLWRVFLSQFTSPLILILLGSAAIMGLLGEWKDSVIIGAVLFFNALIGTYQEGKAQSTLEALKHLSSTTASVLRDGNTQVIDSTLLVPGDIVLLKEGEKISADCRLLEVNRLNVDEASLTGESFPIHKTVKPLPSTALPIADRTNMVFCGTYVTSGMASAIVVATGIHTHIGTLAQELTHLDTQVPLKRKMDQLSRGIVIAVSSFSVVFFVISLLQKNPLIESFSTVISLAVSLIPEGLPVILTLVLARSVSRMSTHNALVKKLAAVEALGQASVIAVDKTGTITLNQLAVTKIFTLGSLYTVTGKGYDPQGTVQKDGKTVHQQKDLALLSQILRCSATAQLVEDERTGQWAIIGDPTEGAALVAAHKLPKLEENWELVSQEPFDYTKKYSSHLFERPKGFVFALLGAPECILSYCLLSKHERDSIESQMHSLSSSGLRLVAVAIKHSRFKHTNSSIKDMELLAILAMQDTIHPEASEAIRLAKASGIHVVMITGDHPNTAIAIAKEVGIYTEHDSVLTGTQLETFSPEQLQSHLKTTTVFARVTPQHKLLLIKAYQRTGETIAMTGDGVNDAASLVAADLGIAMGRVGTEVAKEASDIVLLDDNFKSITMAIKEGRGLYLTIKNVILYLLSTGVGEALTLGTALVLGFTSPLLPVQIIWLNLVTDGFLDVALSMEPREHGLLKRTWKKSETALIDKDSLLRISVLGTTMMIGTMFVFISSSQQDYIKALTMSLTTLAAFQWFNAWNCRSTRSLSTLPIFGNPALILATITVVLLHIAAIHLPLMQGFLHTTSLSGIEWFICVGIGSTIILVEEARKFLFRPRA